MLLVTGYRARVAFKSLLLPFGKTLKFAETPRSAWVHVFRLFPGQRSTSWHGTTFNVTYKFWWKTENLWEPSQFQRHFYWGYHQQSNNGVLRTMTWLLHTSSILLAWSQLVRITLFACGACKGIRGGNTCPPTMIRKASHDHDWMWLEHAEIAYICKKQNAMTCIVIVFLCIFGAVRASQTHNDDVWQSPHLTPTNGASEITIMVSYHNNLPAIIFVSVSVQASIHACICIHLWRPQMAGLHQYLAWPMDSLPGHKKSIEVVEQEIQKTLSTLRTLSLQPSSAFVSGNHLALWKKSQKFSGPETSTQVHTIYIYIFILHNYKMICNYTYNLVI